VADRDGISLSAAAIADHVVEPVTRAASVAVFNAMPSLSATGFDHVCAILPRASIMGAAVVPSRISIF
jgi:hypothetical protein